jgi:hypothetical protein
MGDHWYDRAGKPAYEVQKRDGGLRPTTLADARKLGLVPSVTTVLSVLAKPALEVWKVKQGILAALTLPRAPDEPEDDYLARILSDSGQQAKDAADEGTRIHDAIERSFRGMVVEERYRPHVAGVREELARLFPGVSDWVAESSFASPLGYGGKVDLHSPSTGIVVDHKGKDGDFSDGKKLAYDQHWQLAPYQQGLGLPTNVCANLFFSRTRPGKVASHVWSVEQIAEGWQVFRATLEVWRALKKFDPRFVRAQAA